MFEIADEFAEDPGLFGIGDAPELLLHHRMGEHFRPRPVMDRHLAELAAIDGRRMDSG